MDYKEDIKKVIGHWNFDLLIEEARKGLLTPQQVKDIGLNMEANLSVNGVYAASRRKEDELPDTLRKMFDSWWCSSLHKPEYEGYQRLVSILNEIGLQHLTRRMKPVKALVMDDDLVEKIKKTLSIVTVSKEDKVEFEKRFATQLAETWEEETHCKVVPGIPIEKYPDFLHWLQKTIGIDDTVKAGLKTVRKGDEVEVYDIMNTFNYTQSGLNGKYGMYAAVTQPKLNERDKPVLDVAYSIFSFKVDLFGIKKEGKIESERLMKIKDINISLTQNFIIAKALSAFTDAGVIPYVRYTEDHPPTQMTKVEDTVMEHIKTALSDVAVSRNALVEFEEKLGDQLVREWEEDSQCKIFTGISKSKYEEFLDLFQQTTGIDDTVKAAFKTVAIGKGGVKDILKCFKCNEEGVTGKYGMFAAVTRQDPDLKEDLIDVAYCVFTFKTDLGGFDQKDGQVKIKGNLTDKTARGLKLKDVNYLTQNFLVAKALSVFADAGVIPCVRYTEDHPTIEMTNVEDTVIEPIKSALSSKTVSRNDLVEFEAKLADLLATNWEEDSQCKIFTGILSSKYEEFLDLFQENTGIDDIVKAELSMLLGAGGVSDEIKHLGNGLSGKYGMYRAVRQYPDSDSKEDLIDVAYSVFTFKTDLAVAGTKRENFMVARALSGFREAGVIQRVMIELLRSPTLIMSQAMVKLLSGSKNCRS